ncbi:MAG: alpha/beta hydrolase [Hydrogenophaga sp.]|nr:alpha/beta hydrolase [Hydrogenophaga sp.]
MRRLISLILSVAFLTGCASSVVNVPDSVLHANENAKRAIVFIHGLNGHPTDTWKNPESGGVWHEMLSTDKDLPGDFKVISLSYNASLLESNLTLQEMGRSLKADLRVNRLTNEGPYKEIYFIAHSMGNLALRSLLADEPELFRGVRIPLIISMGSPSTGSELAALGKWLIPGNSQLENLSSSNNQYLADLNKRWSESQGDTRISCGYETVITSGLGMIVTPESAQAVCNGARWPIAANHSYMVKPRDRRDRIYTWTKDELQSTIRAMDARPDIQFVNAYGAAPVAISPAPAPPVQRRTNDVTVENLAEAAKGISIYEVGGFLIDMIPKVEGGVSCAQLTTLLSQASLYDRANVIVRVAGYVQRPLDADCMSRVRRSVVVYDADKAIRALLQPVARNTAPLPQPGHTK